MSDQKKYHGAIEVKDIVSYFLRRINDIKLYVEVSDEQDLIRKFSEVEHSCKELHELASKIAVAERPPDRIVNDPDRGISDFLSSSCDCDDDCEGGCGNCGGGSCGGCSP